MWKNIFWCKVTWEPQCNIPCLSLLICTVSEAGVSPLRAKLISCCDWEKPACYSAITFTFRSFPASLNRHIRTCFVCDFPIACPSFWKESNDLCFVIFRAMSQLIVGCVNWQLRWYLLCCSLEGRSILKGICYSESTLTWTQDWFCGFVAHIATCYRGIDIGFLRKVETGA